MHEGVTTQGAVTLLEGTMRTSKAGETERSDASLYRTVDGGAALGDFTARSARYVAVVLATLLLAAVTLVMTPGGSARASTTFAYDQVFAGVGFSTVNVYDGSSGTLVPPPLVDSTPQLDSNGFPTFTTGGVFDSHNNFYVADDSNNAISEYSSSGAPLGQFATGLDNPESLVFDSSGNLYVGQQSTNYIAEFSPTGQRLGDIGPLATELFGDDWIDLASDQCTFYYTSEGTDIYSFNKCTGQQGVYNTQGSATSPDFNQAPLPGSNAYQLKILADGDMLVADSSAVLLLDPSGNVIQTYSCASLPTPQGAAPCGGLLFAVSVDPNGTSFWTGDAQSGDVWHIDLGTGNVLTSFATGSPGLLFGLTVDGQLMAATSPTITAQTQTFLSPPQTSGPIAFDTPTPVSAVLTDSSGNPVSGEPVTFTLNGDSAESCTSLPTGSDGVASCDITPTVPAATYTLTASFSDSNSTLAQSSNMSPVTVTPDTTTLVYTGPTTAVNGQPVTLTGTLTTDNPSAGTPLNSQQVTIDLGTQSCNGTTQPDGTVSCTIPTVAQTVSNVTVTATYGGSFAQSPASLPTPVWAVVTEPTSLTVQGGPADYGDATTLSGTLTDTLTTAPIVGEQLTLSLNGTDTCTTTVPTDATGTASCSIKPSEKAGTYPLTGTFGGDSGQPLELMASSALSSFVVTLEETTLTYTGPTVAQNGQPLTLSGVLSSESTAPDTDGDSGLGAPIAGRTVAFQLGSSGSAQTCSGVTDATGTASCTITSVSQPQGPIPVTDTFTSDSYYLTANAASMVNLPEGTKLTINPTETSGVYNGSTPVSATLTNTYTGLPVPGEPVTLTVTGAPPCTATTNAAGRRHVQRHAHRAGGELHAVGELPRRLHLDTAAAADELVDHVHRDQGSDHGRLHGPDPADQRPAGHLERRRHLERAHCGHAGRRGDRDLHGRLPELHRDERGQRHRQLHGAQRQPDLWDGHGQHERQREQLLPAVFDQHAGNRPDTDDPDGQRDHRAIRWPDDGDGHADQHGDGTTRRRSNGDAHAQRLADVHGGHSCQRPGQLLHHAERSRGLVPALGFLRGQSLDGDRPRTAADQRVEHLRRDHGADHHHQHQPDDRGERHAHHPVDQGDHDRWQRSERPARHPDARQWEHGAELHRHRIGDRRSELHHHQPEPGVRFIVGHGDVRG